MQMHHQSKKKLKRWEKKLVLINLYFTQILFMVGSLFIKNSAQNNGL